MGSGNSKAKQAQGQDCQKEQLQAPGPEAPSPLKFKGVSLTFLTWLLQYVENPKTTTREVVEGIVKTQSEESRCAYVELLQQEQAHFVGHPDLYIVHAWDRPFHKLAKAVTRAMSVYFPNTPPSKLFVWIDAFCVNQWSEQAPSEVLQGAKAAMASCKGVVVCMDGQAGVLTRSWVLYEMYIAAKLPVTRLIVSAFIKGADLKHRLSSLDLGQASYTTRAEDKAAIIAAVEEDGGGLDGEQPLPRLLSYALLESAKQSVATLEKFKALASEDTQASIARADAAQQAVKMKKGGKGGDAHVLADALEAMKAAKAHEGTVAIEYALAVSRAASFLHALGYTAEAYTLYQEALEVNDEQLGKEHAELECSVLMAMVATYRAAQQWDDAEMCCRNALELYLDKFGEDHIRTARTRVTRAVVLRRAGRHQEAEEEYRRALPVFEQSEGPSSPPTLVVVMGLAQVLMCAKKFKDAEALCKRAVRGLESSLGPSNSKVLAAMGLMGQAVRRQGRGEEAAAIKADIDKRSVGTTACAPDDTRAEPEQATTPVTAPTLTPAVPGFDGLDETPGPSQADEATEETAAGETPPSGASPPPPPPPPPDEPKKVSSLSTAAPPPADDPKKAPSPIPPSEAPSPPADEPEQAPSPSTAPPPPADEPEQAPSPSTVPPPPADEPEKAPSPVPPSEAPSAAEEASEKAPSPAESEQDQEPAHSEKSHSSAGTGCSPNRGSNALTLPDVKNASPLPEIKGANRLPGIFGASPLPDIKHTNLLPGILGASPLPGISQAVRLSGAVGEYDVRGSNAPSEAAADKTNKEQPHNPKAPSSVASTQPEAHPWSQADEARSSHASGKEKARDAHRVYGVLDRYSMSEDSESTRPSWVRASMGRHPPHVLTHPARSLSISKTSLNKEIFPEASESSQGPEASEFDETDKMSGVTGGDGAPKAGATAAAPEAGIEGGMQDGPSDDLNSGSDSF